MRRIVTLALLSLMLQAGGRFIRIDYPNGGETLKPGSQVIVRWRSRGVEGSLAILLFRGSEQQAVIATGVADSGSYPWSIPPGLPGDDRYRLRICSLRDLRLNDFSDRDFSIK